ncbi:type IV toxin-antitoxin system AbiEi family antitoxin [Cellulomonas algicola]|uniref:type IV toxin-antitoxin system AbiEi family antitoxin n=1 Tax=Cellulomonas algicola TaxID=2071633 RepID=UPI001C3FC0A5|nr:type IV toxin-antitoxin system AbiEi family antitoxin [Cellulomonas algicola]
MNSLLDAAIDVLARWEIRALREGDVPARFDAVLTLDAGTRGSARFPTLVKLGQVDRQRATALPLPGGLPVLVVAPYVPTAAAEVLRKRGVAFVDAAGNVSLAWDGMSLDVLGQRPATPAPPRKDPTASRAFTRSGAQVVFALLAWKDLVGRPVREIAAASGASIGTVHSVIGALSDAGYVVGSGQDTALNRAGELLDRWAESYTVNLARKLELGSFALPDTGRADALEHALLGHGAQLGGELAASRIDDHLRPATATFYVDAVPASLVAAFRLRPDDDGPVRLRRRFWRVPDDSAGMVSSPLVYADLVSSGDPRQREHAERIRAVDDRLVELDRT